MQLATKLLLLVSILFGLIPNLQICVFTSEGLRLRSTTSETNSNDAVHGEHITGASPEEKDCTRSRGETSEPNSDYDNEYMAETLVLTVQELEIVLVSVIEHLNGVWCKTTSRGEVTNGENQKKCSERGSDDDINEDAVNETDGSWRPP